MKVLSNSFILILVGSLFAVSAFAQEGLAPEVKLENGISAIVEIIFDESADSTIEAKRDKIVSTLVASSTLAGLKSRNAFSSRKTNCWLDAPKPLIRFCDGSNGQRTDRSKGWLA